MRVLVIGGRGYVGSKVVAALGRLPDVEVFVSSRNPVYDTPFKVDLNDPSTFPIMDTFDYVVNCSDSLKAPPDNAIEYALTQGLNCLEACADLPTIDRLLQKHRTTGVVADGGRRGAVILGMGLFPGFSNILAREAFASQPGCERLEIGVRLSLFAGAGGGTASLMTPMVEMPAIRYESGQRVSEPSLQTGIRMPFWNHQAMTLQVGLPDAVMLHYSTGVPNTAAYVASRPDLPEAVLAKIPALTSGSSRRKQFLLRLMQLQVTMLRTVLLRNVKEPIEITVLTDRQPRLLFRTDDGMLAIGYVMAAALSLMAGSPKPQPGLYLPDELFKLSEIIERMRAIAGDKLELSLRPIQERPNVEMT